MKPNPLPRLLFTAFLLSFLLLSCDNPLAPPPTGTLLTVATPVFSHEKGTYSTDILLTISCSTDGAEIRYTLDDSTPTSTSTLYSGPLDFNGGTSSYNIKAMAFKAGMSNSPFVWANYIINYSQLAQPTLDPDGGTYLGDQSIKILSDLPDITMFYTLDGSTPTTASTRYTQPISITGHNTQVTLKTIATAPQKRNSNVLSASYTVVYSPTAIATSTPLPGTYLPGQTITLSCSTSGVQMYYTLDGSVPTRSSNLYQGTFSLPLQDGIYDIKVLAVKTGLADTVTPTALRYTLATPLAIPAKPSFSIPPGSYSVDQSIQLTTTSLDAVIRYTLDDTPPDLNSPAFSTPILIQGPSNYLTIRARAYFTMGGVSDELVGGFFVNYSAVSAPRFTPPEGNYTTGSQSIVIESEAGAVIHYTTDGQEPTLDSPVYTAPLILATDNTTTLIKALAVKNQMNSSQSSSLYSISYPYIPELNFSLTQGSYNSDQTLAITTSEPGVQIYYTMDGTVPTTASTLYTVPVTLVETSTSGMTFYAKAFKSGFRSSAKLGFYTITYPTLGVVTYSHATQTYTQDQMVTIAHDTPGTTIYYTTNGTTPVVGVSPIYSAPLLIVGDETVTWIKAIADKPGYHSSPVQSTALTIHYPRLNDPNISVPSGYYPKDQSFTLTATDGAAIYYTLDGTTPTKNSTLYDNAPISVTGNGTVANVKAIAIKIGWKDSFVSSSQIRINYFATTITVQNNQRTVQNFYGPTSISKTSGSAEYASETFGLLQQPYTYKWYWDGVQLVGKNQSNLSLDLVSLNPKIGAHWLTYTVSETNGFTFSETKLIWIME